MRKINYIIALIAVLSVVFTNPAFTQDSSSQVNISPEIVKVRQNDPDNLDVRLFRSINNNQTVFLDKSLTIIDKSVLPVSFIIPVSMFVYGRAKNKPYEENTGVLLALSETVNFALVFGIKNIVKRPRPYETLSNVNHKNVSFKDEYSFPSGHTSTAFSIAVTFTLRYHEYPQIYVPMYLWGFAVGYGRMYFGMHYPSDVLSGAVLGSLSAIAIYSLRSEIIKTKNKVFGEENKPDVNKADLRTVGWTSAVCFLSMAALECFYPPIKNLNLQVSPLYNILSGYTGYNIKIDF